MSKISEALKKFFSRVEAVDCSARQEETIDGKAFTYKLYPFSGGSIHAHRSDRITATIKCSSGEVFKVSEEIGKSMIVDTVAIFRCKEAFGMTECIGAAFGEAKK